MKNSGDILHPSGLNAQLIFNFHVKRNKNLKIKFHFISQKIICLPKNCFKVVLYNFFQKILDLYA